MVELPQQNVPGSQSVEITDSVPLEIGSIPALSVTLSGTVTTQNAELPPVGLKRFYGPAQPGVAGSPNVGDILYGVPTPAVNAVLQKVIICNTSNSASWLQLGINGVGHNKCLLHQYSVAANSTAIVDFGGVPLEPDETINAFQQHSGDLTVTLIGTETPL